MKKVLSLLLSLLMLFSITAGIDFSAYALESSGKCGDNVTYTFDSSTGTLTISGIGPMYDYDYVDYHEICTSLFSYDKAIKSVIINYGVTSIGSHTFFGCSSLTSITIPNSVTSIGEDAFWDCSSLTSITIPNSVTSIGNGAFQDCTGLTSITIPNSVTSIGDWTFCDCSNLTSVTIPNSVTNIGEYAFYECTNLTSVTIPDSVTSIGNDAFYLVNNIVYNGTASGSPWGAKAVNGYVDGYLVYKDSTKKELLGCSAQAVCVTIPNSVTSIGNGAFEYCSNLTSVTIPNSVTSIGNGAFSDCSSLTSITIPNSVTSIGEYAFYECTKLTSVTIPNSVTSIEDYVFCDCTSLTSVTIPDSVTSIEDYAFCDCTSLTSITIPNSVTSIGDGAFSWCSSLTSVTIPNSVKTIDDSAFSRCSSLTSITIGNGVTSIGSGAFSYCTNLNKVNISSIEAWCKISFYDFDSNPLHQAKNLYHNDELVTDLVIPDSVNSICSYAFYGCTSLTSVTIPNSVTSIGEEAFTNCSSLTSVTIPNSVTSIGDWAFCDCTSLTSITIPNSVTSIGDYAFAYCSSLTSVTIPNSVTSIGNSAFYDCSSLTSVTIPNSVTSIGDRAFEDCTSLTSITIPNNVTSIGEDAFYYCTSLKDVYYTGSESQWNNISIGSYNNALEDATIHYNYVPPCYHDIVIDKAVAPTCTEPGLTQGSHCSVCEKIIVPQEIVKPTGHKYDSGKVTKAATCKATGVKTYTCTVCGEKKTATIAKTAHTYKNYVTKATLTANGKIVNKCSVCGVVKSTTAIPLVKTFTLSATNYTYDGKVKTPAVTVKDSKGKTLRKGTDYDVTYSSGRKNVGKYAVKITLKGNYYGTKTLYFNINPKGTTIAKLTPKSRAIAVQWKKQTNQTTGYQIQYSVYSNFKSAKTITMSKNTYYAKSITGLSGNKRYYVRIRTYKTVKFNGKNYNLYSHWSSVKYTTTKK